MYRELNESEVKTGTQIMREHPGVAYMIINIMQPHVNGVTLETRGNLFAIADEDGLEELYTACDVVEAQGITALIDTIPLSSGKSFFTDYFV